MQKFVRASKYRHVFAPATSKETLWDGVKLSRNTWDSNFVTVNPSYAAIAWQVGGGGAAGIVDLSDTTNKKLDKVPLITGHKGPILDLEFNPFHDNILATVSEDTYGKIWVFPPKPTNQDTEAQILKGHQRKVGNVVWNPIADNVLATSASDYTVKIWDVTTGDEKWSLLGHGGIIHSLKWNYQGSTLCSYCKDKKVRVIDPRANEIVGETAAHMGVMGGRALWLGRHEKIFTVGFGKTSDRQYFIFDAKNLSSPLVGPVTIDNSAGTIIPFYDEDSELLFLAGKGDGNIRYYEIEPETPEVFFISQFSSNEPTAAIGSMPKRGCDVNTNEIFKLFRVIRNKLEPISFKVPRKSDLFQKDIFPDCRSDEPALTSEQWFSGENSTPILKSLQGGFDKKETTFSGFQKKEEVEEILSEAEVRKENVELKKRVVYLEAELAKASSKLN